MMKRTFSILLLSVAVGVGQGTNKLSSYPVVSALDGTERFPIFVPAVGNYSISANALGTWLVARVSAQPPSLNLSNWSLLSTNVLASGGGGGAASGDGSALVNLNASALASGTVPAARLSSANLITALGYTPAVSGATIPMDIERAVPLNQRDVLYGGSRSSANQSGTVRWQILPAVASHDVQLIYLNMYRPGSGFLTPNGNAVTIKCALEVNGYTYPAFFNGHRTNVLDPGATCITDAICCTVKPTDTVYVRTFFDAGTGGYIPTTHAFQGSGTGSDSITYGSDLCDNNGALGAISQPLSWGPVSVIAVPDGASRVAVALIGDSIIYGSGEAFPNDANLWKAQWGFAARALQPAGLGYVKTCVGGDMIQNYTNSGWMRTLSTKGATIAICNYGVNDLKTGASVNSMKANLQSIWNYWASKRLKVYQTTITPESTSTDGFTTLANQTAFAYEANRSGLNAWLRDATASGAVGQSGGALSGVFDVAAVVEAAGGKWAVTNAAYCSGTITSAAATWAQDINQSVPAPHVLDYAAVIKITGGAGAGQVQTITANSPANKFYVASWSTQPDATSTYEIWWVYTSDGEHPRSVGHAAMASKVNTTLFTWP